MSNLLERITVNPEQCGGRPCIRGMRIRVTDVLDLFAAGLSAEQLLEEMPDLEADDLKAALLYAARWLDHPVSGGTWCVYGLAVCVVTGLVFVSIAKAVGRALKQKFMGRMGAGMMGQFGQPGMKQAKGKRR